jgi:hypothetical protein
MVQLEVTSLGKQEGFLAEFIHRRTRNDNRRVNCQPYLTQDFFAARTNESNPDWRPTRHLWKDMTDVHETP